MVHFSASREDTEGRQDNLIQITVPRAIFVFDVDLLLLFLGRYYFPYSLQDHVDSQIL